MLRWRDSIVNESIPHRKNELWTLLTFKMSYDMVDCILCFLIWLSLHKFMVYTSANCSGLAFWSHTLNVGKAREVQIFKNTFLFRFIPIFNVCPVLKSTSSHFSLSEKSVLLDLVRIGTAAYVIKGPSCTLYIWRIGCVWHLLYYFKIFFLYICKETSTFISILANFLKLI